jgi:hypothetical protein
MRRRADAPRAARGGAPAQAEWSAESEPTYWSPMRVRMWPALFSGSPVCLAGVRAAQRPFDDDARGLDPGVASAARAAI